jgi:integrase
MPALTVAAIRRFKPIAGKRREIRDSLAPGLHLVIQPSGHRSWCMRFRRPGGRSGKLVLGRTELSDSEPTDAPVVGGALTLRQARELANQIDRQRARGVDVIAEYAAAKHRQRIETANRGANTFGSLAVEFFADHKVKRWGTRPRRWREDARLLGLDWPRNCDPAETEPKIIKGGLAARWTNKPVAEITDDDIFEAVREARRTGVPGLARRNRGTSENRARKLHSALSVLFRWLLRHRKVRSNPCLSVERPSAPPPRQRSLSGGEVRLLWKGCEKLGAPYGPMMQVLLLTGARLAEVAGMCRDEFSEDGATWTVPGERSKNHRPHLLPLPPQVQTVLAALPRIEGSSLIFTNTGKQLTGFSHVKIDLDKAMLAIARKQDKAATVSPWRIHDLRRSAATGMADLGVQPHIVEAVLNNVSGHKAGVAGTYNLAEYRPEKQEALRRWAQHVQGVVTGTQANVTPLRTGGRT